MMKALITGINGLLGSNTAKVLLEAGYEVRGMTRRPGPLATLDGLDVHRVMGSVENREDVDRAVKGCSIVIHGAANTRQYPTGLNHYTAVNIHGTRHLLWACKKHRVERLIYVSTANVFGHSSPDRPADESSPFNFGDIASGYIHSKYLAQQEVLKEVRETGLPAVVVNPTFLIGAGDSGRGSGSIVSDYAYRRFIPCPPGSKNFIHVRDAAVAIKNAIQQGRTGECYILGNRNLSYKQFFTKVIFCTGRAARLVPLPGMLLRGTGTAMSAMQSMLPLNFPLNRVNAKLLCAHLCYSPLKAVKELNLPQTPIEQAIRDTLAWSASQNKAAGPGPRPVLSQEDAYAVQT